MTAIGIPIAGIGIACRAIGSRRYEESVFGDWGEAYARRPLAYGALAAGVVAFAALAGLALRLPGFGPIISIHIVITASLAVGSITTIIFGWHRLRSLRVVRVGPLLVPREVFTLVIPAGVCSAVVHLTLVRSWIAQDAAALAWIMCAASAASLALDYLKKRAIYRGHSASILSLIAACAAWMMMASGEHWAPINWVLAICGAGAVIGRVFFVHVFKRTRPRGALLGARGFIAAELLSAFVVTALISGLAEPGPPGLVLSQAVGFGVAWGVTQLFAGGLLLLAGRGAMHSTAAWSVSLALAWMSLWALPGLDKPLNLQLGISLAFVLVAVASLIRTEKRLTREVHFDVSQAWRISHEVPVRLRRRPDAPDRGSPPGPRAF